MSLLFLTLQCKKQLKDKTTPGFYVDEEWQNNSPGIVLFGGSF